MNLILLLEKLFEHCQYQVRLCDKSQEYTPEINDTFKVIGNIFQNPELIKN